MQQTIKMSLYKPVPLSSTLYDTVCARIRESYPNSCILYIDQVNNSSLQQKYDDRKATLSALRSSAVEEKQMFHGTKFANVDKIANNGFQVEYNQRSSYGRGTYFSNFASYSRDYTNTDNELVSYMFLCDVLVGKCVVVSGGRPIDTRLYDNGVDNLTIPSIVVCPYNDGCYPRYLIAFHKNAR